MKFWKAAACAAAMTVASMGVAHAQDTLGGKPNLNGIWQAMNSAYWDLEPHSAQTAPAGERQVGVYAAIPAGLGVVEGGTIPYKPEALAKLEENQRNRVRNDPEAACYLPGIPRATYLPHPFQIIQGEKGDMLMVYEYHSANRAIFMRETEVPPIDTWMGTSYGKWDGNTLVVTTLAQSPGDVIRPGGPLEPDYTWLDRSGNYITPAGTVVERFSLRDKDHIDYEATIDDPSIYTRPWKIKMPLYRRVEANAQLLEFNCVPFSEMFLLGDLLDDKPAGQ